MVLKGLLMPRIVTLIGFIALVLGGGLLIGYLNAPGSWYAGLIKPSFNPPNWIFGPVWTVLYVFIAIAGWRVWQMDSPGPGRFIWTLQMVLNFMWSPVFFSAQKIGLALIIIMGLLASVLMFTAWAWVRDRVGAYLFMPYAAWVGFASVLNASLLMLN